MRIFDARERVWHPTYGKGIVVADEPWCSVILVAFETEPKIWRMLVARERETLARIDTESLESSL
jgi:hypothetical protein